MLGTEVNGQLSQDVNAVTDKLQKNKKFLRTIIVCTTNYVLE